MHVCVWGGGGLGRSRSNRSFCNFVTVSECLSTIKYRALLHINNMLSLWHSQAASSVDLDVMLPTAQMVIVDVSNSGGGLHADPEQLFMAFKGVETDQSEQQAAVTSGKDAKMAHAM